jgi:hypothetical protein
MCIIVCFASKNNNGNYKAKKLQKEERQGTICRKLSLEMISYVNMKEKFDVVCTIGSNSYYHVLQKN